MKNFIFMNAAKLKVRQMITTLNWRIMAISIKTFWLFGQNSFSFGRFDLINNSKESTIKCKTCFTLTSFESIF